MFSLFSFSLCELFACWMNNGKRKTSQFKYWIITIPESAWNAPEELPGWASYIAGQVEVAPSTGYRHWQVLCCLSKRATLSSLKQLFGCPNMHAEKAVSSSEARAYVLKEDTSVPGTRFELGEFSLRRNSKTDWDKVLQKAKVGALDEVPPDVTIRFYSTLRRISIDYGTPIVRGEQSVHLYWGDTGTGKTKKFYDEIGTSSYYLKAPTTKWWDGYRGQETVLVDEFRGLIEISHLLKWLDRYPCACEVKGAQVFLNTKKWVFTSNLPLEQWYKDIDAETLNALRRRFTLIVHFSANTPEPFRPGWKGKDRLIE